MIKYTKFFAVTAMAVLVNLSKVSASENGLAVTASELHQAGNMEKQTLIRGGEKYPTTSSKGRNLQTFSFATALGASFTFITSSASATLSLLSSGLTQLLPALFTFDISKITEAIAQIGATYITQITANLAGLAIGFLPGQFSNFLGTLLESFDPLDAGIKQSPKPYNTTTATCDYSYTISAGEISGISKLTLTTVAITNFQYEGQKLAFDADIQMTQATGSPAPKLVYKGEASVSGTNCTAKTEAYEFTHEFTDFSIIMDFSLDSTVVGQTMNITKLDFTTFEVTGLDVPDSMSLTDSVAAELMPDALKTTLKAYAAKNVEPLVGEVDLDSFLGEIEVEIPFVVELPVEIPF